MANSTSSPNNCISLEDAKNALTEILESFKIPENEERLEEARDNAGNDMLKMMQIVFPLATQMQMKVIQQYGYSPDGDGIIRFTQTIKHFEKQDQEIAELNAKLRSVLIPQMAAPAPQSTET